MRLIIIDDVNPSDIAEILGTVKSGKLEKTYPEGVPVSIGDTVQVDDPNTGYHRGKIDEIKNGSVHLLDVGWFSAEFISGVIS